MSKHEKVIFNGKIYRSYPNSKIKNHRYFTDNKGNRLHRDIWILHHGEIPNGYHIHHKDGNRLNNSLENFCCLTPKEHFLSHSKLSKVDPSKDIYNSSRKWHKSNEGIIHHKKVANEYWSNATKKMIPCDICKIMCERFKKQSKKTVCKICKLKKQLQKQKTNYIKKERKTLLVICKICNKKTIQKTKKTKNICSNGCKSKARVLSGIDNVLKNCLICDKEYLINKYSKTQTCSGSCRSQFITLRMRSRRSISVVTKVDNIASVM